MRKLPFALTSMLFLVLLAAVPALAETAATDFQGTYVGSVRTSNGNDLGAFVWVKDVGGGMVDLTVFVAGQPGIPLKTQAVWSGPNSFTISPSVYLPFVVDGSGSATFTKSGTAWTVTGSGSGTALSIPGSANGGGTKMGDDYTKYNVTVAANPTAAAGGAGSGGGPIAGMSEKQPPVSEPEKAEAALTEDFAVLAALILTIAMGASMSGAEFADMWLEK